ncbi:hypothetical protein [Sphingomonas quercus]|uniref:Uncharacterized protein n=1 Tax=Sphingomonas quercus TaxID=2842451 RepID=A0ABS6BKG4_9SPHN|nr:hypothetical protein [Sphingomonas quercus]MBU3078779.1 hypothetical protein [Sphingomonas quercus]
MIIALSKALMTLATNSLGESRSDWAQAMACEFEVATADGKPLSFAAGCLIAACCEIPRHSEGRLALTNYALALGLLIPMAALQVAQMTGLPLLLTGSADGIPTAGVNSSPYLILSRLSAAPILLALWLSLGVAHLCLAWAVVERNGPRVVKAAALMGAAVLTLFLLMGVLLINMASLAGHVAAMAAELALVAIVARLHARLHSSAAADLIA